MSSTECNSQTINDPQKLHSAKVSTSVKNPVSLYSLKLQQRRKNLDEEKYKLELAKKKLRRDMNSIKAEQNYFLEQDKKLENIETEITKSESEIEKLELTPNSLDLSQQKTFLQKTAADLRQQLEFAQEELNLVKKQSEDKSNEEQTRLMLEKQIAEKTMRVEKLHDLFDTLNNEVLTRENEVMEMELQAIEHKELVEKASKKKDELLRRKRACEEEKQKLQNSIRNREKQRLEIEEQIKNAQDQLNKARNISLELEHNSKTLDDREHDLQLKREKLQNLKIELEKKRTSRINTEMKRKEERDAMKAKLSTLTSFDDNIDTYELERIIEQDEKSLAQRRQEFALQRENYEKSYAEKKQKSLDLLSELKQRLIEAGNEEDLEFQMKQLTESNKNLQSKIEEKTKQIDEIKKQILTDEQMQQCEIDLQNRIKEIMAKEKSTNQRLAALQIEEDELDNSEETITSTREEIESEKRMLKLKMDASTKMFNIYTQQLNAAQERLQNLTKQLQQIENSTTTNY